MPCASMLRLTMAFAAESDAKFARQYGDCEGQDVVVTEVEQCEHCRKIIACACGRRRYQSKPMDLHTSSSYFVNSTSTPARSARACNSTFRKLSCACANLMRYVGIAAVCRVLYPKLGKLCILSVRYRHVGDKLNLVACYIAVQESRAN
jgi:hypothetical protein